MLDFGAAERLGMQAAGFFELQCGLLRDAETQAAPQYEQMLSGIQFLHEAVPIKLPCKCQLRRRFGKRMQQRRIVCPSAPPGGVWPTKNRCTTSSPQR